MRRARAHGGGRLPSSTLRGAKKKPRAPKQALPRRRAKARRSMMRLRRRVIAAHPDSEFALTNCNHSHLTFPNRSSTRCFSRSSLKLPAVQLPESNRPLETIRNSRNPFTINRMTFSNRPKIADPTRVGVLSDQREPKELSSDQIRKRNINPRTRAKKRPRAPKQAFPRRRLVATVANSRFHSSSSQQRTSHFSTRNKNDDPARIVVLRDRREPKELSSVFLRTHQPSGAEHKKAKSRSLVGQTPASVGMTARGRRKGKINGRRRLRFDLLFGYRIESNRQLIRLRALVTKGELTR